MENRQGRAYATGSERHGWLRTLAVIIGETKTYIYKDKMGWYVYPKEKITAKDIEMGRRKVIQSFI